MVASRGLYSSIATKTNKSELAHMKMYFIKSGNFLKLLPQAKVRFCVAVQLIPFSKPLTTERVSFMGNRRHSRTVRKNLLKVICFRIPSTVKRPLQKAIILCQ